MKRRPFPSPPEVVAKRGRPSKATKPNDPLVRKDVHTALKDLNLMPNFGVVHLKSSKMILTKFLVYLMCLSESSDLKRMLRKRSFSYVPKIL